MKTFDVPLNLRVHAETEQKADDLVMSMIRLAITEYALEKEIIDYDICEFVPETSTKECCGA